MVHNSSSYHFTYLPKSISSIVFLSDLHFSLLPLYKIVCWNSSSHYNSYSSHSDELIQISWHEIEQQLKLEMLYHYFCWFYIVVLFHYIDLDLHHHLRCQSKVCNCQTVYIVACLCSILYSLKQIVQVCILFGITLFCSRYLY